MASSETPRLVGTTDCGPTCLPCLELTTCSQDQGSSQALHQISKPGMPWCVHLFPTTAMPSKRQTPMYTMKFWRLILANREAFWQLRICGMRLQPELGLVRRWHTKPRTAQSEPGSLQRRDGMPLLRLGLTFVPIWISMTLEAFSIVWNPRFGFPATTQSVGAQCRGGPTPIFVDG